MTGFRLPRLLATLAAMFVAAAIVVWPLAGLPVSSALLMVCALCLGIMSYDLDRRVRLAHRLAEDQRRRAKTSAGVVPFVFEKALAEAMDKAFGMEKPERAA